MKKISLSLAATLVAANAFAATSGTTTASTEEVAPSLLNKISIKLVGVLYGPSITTLTTGEDSTSTPAANGDPDGAMFFENALATDYKITNELKAGVVTNFLYRPVIGQDIEMLDPAIRIAHSKAISAGNFNMATDARFYLPTSERSGKANHLTRFRTSQVMSYSLGSGSRWSLGGELYENVYFWNAGSAMSSTVFRINAEASASYQLNDRTSFSFAFGNEFRNYRNANSVTDWGSKDAYFTTSMGMDVIPSRLNLSPYLQIYTDNVMLKSTSLGMVLSATVL